ncbi:MAG TPA: putative methyltransferase [Thermoplasmata archaeon]|nr:putative methyltransferase [Thermoplasmata archaeon]
MDRIKNQIIYLLSSGENSVWKIIDFQDASLPEFFEKLNEMEKEGIIKMEKGIVSLTNKGKEIVHEYPFKELKCMECEGTGYKIMADIKKKYEKILKNRPKPIEEYDQGYISIEIALRKLAFLIERGDIFGEIFILGDDDLFSISLALTFLPKKIVVVDIDERIIDFINKTADEYSLKIEAFLQDLQNENEKFLRKFDVFVTDPVETLPGIKLFLSRGTSSLKGIGSSGYFGLSTLEASRKKWFEIQKMINEMGFVITDIKRQFQVYPDDGKNFFEYQEKLPIVKKLKSKSNYNWYKSALYRIEAVKEPNPLIRGDLMLGEKLYRDEESWATPL